MRWRCSGLYLSLPYGISGIQTAGKGKNTNENQREREKERERKRKGRSVGNVVTHRAARPWLQPAPGVARAGKGAAGGDRRGRCHPGVTFDWREAGKDESEGRKKSLLLQDCCVISMLRFQVDLKDELSSNWGFSCIFSFPA